VLATTRQEAKRAALQAAGADYVIVSEDELAPAVHALLPDGANGLCELVGPDALARSLHALAPGAGACITGYLEGNWDTAAVEAEAQRLGVRLHRFGSDAITRDSYEGVFAEIVSAIEQGRYGANVDRVFALEEIADAHRYMEANRAAGKVVVLAH
jgi:NADPH2:quinone reductase